MADALHARSGVSRSNQGKMTMFVFFTCLAAATGGLIFGYDIGIFNGVTAMQPFLNKFYIKMSPDQYFKYENMKLTLFTSSIYPVALVASFFASIMTRKFGRKVSMLLGGLVFLVGTVINIFSQNLAMLIIGRVLLGVGVGFINQSVPIYLSEMAPTKFRGMFNIGFQLMITIGTLAANLINYATSKINSDEGWRISLGLAVVPALIVTLGSLFLPDTPNSLIARGYDEAAWDMLCRIRGTSDIDQEYANLVTASEASRAVEKPWRNMLKRKYRAQLVMAVMIPFFQQLVGINVILLFVPALLRLIGFVDHASLLSTIIIGSVNVIVTFISILTVDRLGRRFLFLQGGLLMIACEFLVGLLIGLKIGTTGMGTMSTEYATLVVVFICLYTAGFAWSWGPLGWLIPSEIFPLEIRSAGQSITVCVNMACTFVISQIFRTMLYHFKYKLFYYFAAWDMIKTVFICVFLPETKNVSIEEMILVWKRHRLVWEMMMLILNWLVSD